MINKRYQEKYYYTLIKDEVQYHRVMDSLVSKGFDDNGITWQALVNSYKHQQKIIIYPKKYSPSSTKGIMFCHAGWAEEENVTRKNMFYDVIPEELFAL